MFLLANAGSYAASSNTTDSSGAVFGFFIVLFFIIVIFKGVSSKPPSSPKPPKPSYRSDYPTGRKLTPRYYPSAYEAANFNPEGLRVFGTPGKSLLSSDFSESSIQNGVLGEQKTAEIIDSFAQKSTNCYVFHSLRWPLSSTEADVDHIIVCGNNMLLLDSKNWRKKGVYAFNWDGDITVNGEYYRYGKNPKVFSARDKYEDYTNQYFPFGGSVRVGSTIVIHSPGSSVDKKPFTRWNRLSSATDLEKLLHDWELSLGIVQDNKKLLCAIHHLLK